MSKQLKPIVFNSIMLIFLYLSVNVQINGQAKYIYWYNAPSAPLQIHGEESDSQDPITRLNNSLFFENISQATITGYQYGCIIEKDKNIEIISAGIVEKDEINSIAAKDNKSFFPSSPHGNYLQNQCIKGKVTIIRVDFIDGGVWTFKNAGLAK